MIPRRGRDSRFAALLAVLIVFGSAAPARADAERDRQWYYGPLKLTQAQRLGNGGAGVIVAVIDSGVDPAQQDLRGALVAGRVMGGDRPVGGFGTGPHGTGIAVTIAGRGHGDREGLLGVAPRSRIMPIRPVNNSALVADGIRWAVAHGAKVINMSFRLDAGPSLREAIDRAVADDVVVVAAAGNDGGDVAEPAACHNVLAVGSIDRNGKVAGFSNHGPALDLVTYGTEIPVARPGNTYGTAEGTSDSSAIVAGAAALIRARFPDMTAAEVIARLTGTAHDLGPKGRDDRYGAGRLDLIAALTAPRTVPGAESTPAVTVAGLVDDGGAGIQPLVLIGAGVVLLIGAVSVLFLLRRPGSLAGLK